MQGTGGERAARDPATEPEFPSEQLQRSVDHSPRMLAQRRLLQSLTGHGGDRNPVQRQVAQRLSAKAGALLWRIEASLKRVRALTVTEMAARDLGGDADEIARLGDVLDQAGAELKRLEAADLVEEAREGGIPSMNFLTEGHPAYLSNGKLVLTGAVHQLTLARQVALITDLLAGERASEALIDFILARGHEGAAAAGNHETFRLSDGARFYRVAKAPSVRSYVLSGIGRVRNNEHWTELGNGFYVSPDREGAAAYAPMVGKPAALMELGLRDSAVCRRFVDTTEVDGKTEQQIKDRFGDSDAVCDGAMSQIKFHSPFYQEQLEILRVWTQNAADEWEAHETPQAFVDAYEDFLIDRHQRKADEQPRKPTAPPSVLDVADFPDANDALRHAPDATPGDMEGIAFIDAAMAFERALGAHLANHRPALDAAGALASAIWERLSDKQRAKLGSKQATVTGMVGAELTTLRAVVESGNLRERLTLVYNGYVAGVFGKLERPEQLNALRSQRQDVPEKDRRGAPHARDVQPALSDREWFSAVDGQGRLSWEPGQDLHHFPMSSAYQDEAEALLRPVSTGPSGTAYGIFQVAHQVEAEVEPQLLRLAILGWMMPVGDHTFDEIMTACQAFDDTLTYDPASLTRYRVLAPFSEDALRALAPDRLFPDEHAQAAKERARRL